MPASEVFLVAVTCCVTDLLTGSQVFPRPQIWNSIPRYCKNSVRFLLCQKHLKNLLLMQSEDCAGSERRLTGPTQLCWCQNVNCVSVCVVQRVSSASGWGKRPGLDCTCVSHSNLTATCHIKTSPCSQPLAWFLLAVQIASCYRFLPALLTSTFLKMVSHNQWFFCTLNSINSSG